MITIKQVSDQPKKEGLAYIKGVLDAGGYIIKGTLYGEDGRVLMVNIWEAMTDPQRESGLKDRPVRKFTKL